MKYITEELFQQAVADRRYLHAHPEIGFDLDETVAYVKAQLDAAGIAYTERFCDHSVCAFLGDQSGQKPIVALRADMDALPIQEATGLPYASVHPGKMHACGHDSHTAVLLAVGRLLKARESELPCGVKLMFQPAEETAECGSEYMVNNGVLDDVCCVLGTHSENTLDAGNVGICRGAYMSACIPVDVTFLGRSAHAAMPEQGVDAIAMAVRAWEAMRQVVAEEAGGAPYIWSVGSFHAGTAHNIIAGRCDLKITFRYYDTAFAERAMARVEAVCRDIAASLGGSAEVNWAVSCPPLINDDRVLDHFQHAAEQAGLPLKTLPRRMSSEDFSWFLTRRPGAIFRFGTRNEALGCTALAHRADFMIDEEGMRAGIEAFAAFILENDFADLASH